MEDAVIVSAVRTPVGSFGGQCINVAPLTEVMAERAAGLRSQHVRLRLPDAVVLACAAELDAELLTYDDRLAAIARNAA
jgi:predicted nucleic acid-binding protein